MDRPTKAAFERRVGRRARRGGNSERGQSQESGVKNLAHKWKTAADFH
jgi:hypothetical protein